MNKYGLHGKLTATAGNADQLAAILLEAAQLMATAKGCQLYVVSKDQNNPDAVWVTEIWNRKEDHDQSLQVAGVRELIARAIPLLHGKPEQGQELEIIGGAGIA